jgi:hypothetical protein
MLHRGLILALALLVFAVPAEAAVTAQVAVSGKRLVVTLRGVKAKAVTLVAGGKSYKLTKSGAKWRSATIANVEALQGKTVKVKVRPTKGAAKTLSATIPGGAAPKQPGATTPAPAPAPAPAPTATPHLFPPPAAPTTGNAAFDEIKGYLIDSRFTDCPAGWPNCGPYEVRYSFFADGGQWYCRLTPTSGSDVKSFGTLQAISGAEHTADGSWGFEYYLSTYGNTVFYSWSVSPDGIANGRYWGHGRTPSSGQPDETIGPLQWVRGAKDCSY